MAHYIFLGVTSVKRRLKDFAIADEVTKVHAICVKCGSVAYVSHRLVNNDKRVLLGEKDEYEPLCRECYQKAILNEKS